MKNLLVATAVLWGKMLWNEMESPIKYETANRAWQKPNPFYIYKQYQYIKEHLQNCVKYHN